MPLFRSLRSKSSLKSSSASILSDKDTDFGPRSPSQTTYGSVKGKSDFGSLSRSHKHTPSSGSGVKQANVASLPSVGAFGEAQSEKPNVPSGVTSVDDNASTATSAPRPSELFAGKGVQWDSVKLAGPGASPAVQHRNTTNNSEDLQNFLKQRRQWKPTFVTEETVPRQTPTRDLNQLSFTSQDTTLQSKGLMSFEDLDKSHQRKQKLLSDNPLGPTLWEEAETSKAGQRRNAGKVGSAVAASSAAEAPKRRTGSFKSPVRKEVPGASEADALASSTGVAGGVPAVLPSAAPKAPSRSTSAQQVPLDLAENSTKADAAKSNGSAALSSAGNAPPNTADLPPPVDAATLSATGNSVDQSSLSPAVRQSTELSSGFVTADNSRPPSKEDLHTGSAPLNGEGQHQSSVNRSPSVKRSDLPATVPEEPATPRGSKTASGAAASVEEATA